jgi:hypothetical protein
MAGAHGNVGHAKVEQGLRRVGVVELVEAGQVVVQRRLQRPIEQMLDREALVK